MANIPQSRKKVNQYEFIKRGVKIAPVKGRMGSQQPLDCMLAEGLALVPLIFVGVGIGIGIGIDQLSSEILNAVQDPANPAGTTMEHRA